MAKGDRTYVTMPGISEYLGVAVVDGVKTIRINYGHSFNKKPNVVFSLGDNTAAHAPKRKVTKKDHFKIRFKTNYTGEVDWRVTASANEFD